MNLSDQFLNALDLLERFVDIKAQLRGELEAYRPADPHADDFRVSFEEREHLFVAFFRTEMRDVRLRDAKIGRHDDIGDRQHAIPDRVDVAGQRTADFFLDELRNARGTDGHGLLHLVKRTLDFNLLEGFDHVPDLDIVEVVQADTALEAGLDITNVILEALERENRAGVHDNAVAQQADAAVAVDLAVLHIAAGNRTDMRDLEHIAHEDGRCDLFLDFGTEHALKRIAHILGTLDDKIELNRRMNATLEAMARALFKSWFVDFDPVRAKAAGRDPGLPAEIAALFPAALVESALGMVPEGWGVKLLPDVIRVNPTRSLGKNADAPYVEMARLDTGSARINGWVMRQPGSGSRFANGDTLLARITPCLENGKTAFVDFLEPDQIGWGSTEFIVLRSGDGLPAAYTYFLARTDQFRAFAIANMTGTSGRQRVPNDSFSNYSVVMPPQPLADEFGHFADLALEKMKANDEQSATLAALRDTLLPRLLSGEVRVPPLAI